MKEQVNGQVAAVSGLGVPHLLVHGSGDQMQHVLTSSLEDAMVYAEHLANDRDEQSFRVFEMREIPMAVKRYYSVELMGAEGSMVSAVDPSSVMDEVGTPVEVAVEAPVDLDEGSDDFDAYLDGDLDGGLGGVDDADDLAVDIDNETGIDNDIGIDLDEPVTAPEPPERLPRIIPLSA